ncbi:hypothetical protein Daus18300_012470 [Diaporthe australafricana]|uniref:Uncharacterized protein n=1 Tax=Diaporthe australafricana TaxID=127596 RepID=A0ABR3W2K7_9PEZI
MTMKHILEGYAFLYFTASDESIDLASSNGNNGLSFTELNNGQPVLTSNLGDGGGDKFFILATDLCTGCGTSSWAEAPAPHGKPAHRGLGVARPRHLLSEQRHVRVSPPPGSNGNTWAPEAYWDRELRAYLVYWASGIYDDDDDAADPGRERTEYQRDGVRHHGRLRDVFGEPVVWQDEPPGGRIDSTVILEEEGGMYYRFTKATVDGCADIVQESSPSLTAGLDGWARVASCIGTSAEWHGRGGRPTNPGDVNGERYVLIVDELDGDGYVPLESADLTTGEWALSNNYSYPITPRRGTILPLTAVELEAIVEAYGSAA